MNDDDLVAAMTPVDRAFRHLDVRFYVGGSVASSFRGAMRSTMDVDLVADINQQHVPPLIEMLANDYYASAVAIHDAIKQRSSFNLIHLSTSFKVDVFVNQQTEFEVLAFQRATLEEIGSATNTLRLPIASVEDILLAKLKWYRLGDEVSQRQWDDVSRLTKLHSNTLEWDYLDTQAREAKVADLLGRLRDLKS